MGDCSKEITLEKARPDQFYSVFKSQACLLKEICPDIVYDIQLGDGATGWEAVPGLHKNIDYHSADGKRYRITDRVAEVDTSTKTISYVIDYGQIKDNISKVKLQVRDDSTAVWTVSYIKTVPNDYLKLLVAITQAVDNHFAKN